MPEAIGSLEMSAPLWSEKLENVPGHGVLSIDPARGTSHYYYKK